MIISDIQCNSYSMPLVKPLGIAGEKLMVRECTQLIIIGSDGEKGAGELCPLPEFSSESYEEANLQLLSLCKSLKGEGIPTSLDKLALFSFNNLQCCFPSVRNAVELALYNYICLSLKHDTCRVALNGLIMSGATDNNIRGVEKLLADGYSSIKLKVGRHSIEDDIAFVEDVLNTVDGKAQVRLDANRSWSLDEAIRFGKAVACDAVEYIEEPVKDREEQLAFFQQTGIDIALDESLYEYQLQGVSSSAPEQLQGGSSSASQLQGVSSSAPEHQLQGVSSSAPEPLLPAESCSGRQAKVGAMSLSPSLSGSNLRGVSAFVIKPLLVGGIVKTIELVRFALDNGITPVLSCCFESDAAVRTYALLADEMGVCDIPQGLDTWKWLEDHNRTFRVSNGVLEVL